MDSLKKKRNYPHYTQVVGRLGGHSSSPLQGGKPPQQISLLSGTSHMLIHQHAPASDQKSSVKPKSELGVIVLTDSECSFAVKKSYSPQNVVMKSTSTGVFGNLLEHVTEPSNLNLKVPAKEGSSRVKMTGSSAVMASYAQKQLLESAHPSTILGNLSSNGSRMQVPKFGDYSNMHRATQSNAAMSPDSRVNIEGQSSNTSEPELSSPMRPARLPQNNTQQTYGSCTSPHLTRKETMSDDLNLQAKNLMLIESQTAKALLNLKNADDYLATHSQHEDDQQKSQQQSAHNRHSVLVRKGSDLEKGSKQTASHTNNNPDAAGHQKSRNHDADLNKSLPVMKPPNIQDNAVQTMMCDLPSDMMNLGSGLTSPQNMHSGPNSAIPNQLLHIKFGKEQLNTANDFAQSQVFSNILKYRRTRPQKAHSQLGFHSRSPVTGTTKTCQGGRIIPSKPKSLYKMLPHLKKKYEGGIWGYGERGNSNELNASIAQKEDSSKILLSHTFKQGDYSFNNNNLNQFLYQNPQQTENSCRRKGASIERIFSSLKKEDHSNSRASTRQTQQSVRDSTIEPYNKKNPTKTEKEKEQGNRFGNKLDYSQTKTRCSTKTRVSTILSPTSRTAKQTGTAQSRPISMQNFLSVDPDMVTFKNEETMSHHGSPGPCTPLKNRAQQQSRAYHSRCPPRNHIAISSEIPLRKQPLKQLVEMDLQVMFEKYRREPDDYSLPLYYMKPPTDHTYSSKMKARRKDNRIVIIGEPRPAFKRNDMKLWLQNGEVVETGVGKVNF